ncbi:MAG TPA: hypothetical protein PKD31_03000 [Blastocatellia bacterium]|nr:hypothetical protein [Blastocatellia bacterium]
MQAALDRVLSSKHFAHAPMKQRFLRLICEFHLGGRGGELNEYLIGREVFDRDSSYNPATDPIVRVGAHGVREKLERYYQKDGANDAVKIEIPVGSYEPSFSRAAQPVAAKPAIIEETVSETIPPLQVSGSEKLPAKLFRHYWTQATAGILSLLILGLVYSNFSLRQQAAEAAQRQNRDTEVYQTVWQAFMGSSDPTLLVLSNPPVFRFINPADPEQVVKKSVPISTEQTQNIFSGIQNKSIIRIINNPRLTMTTDTYTGIGEAVGVYHITDLFRGSEKSLTLKQSRTVSAEDLKSQNIVALGSIWVNSWSNKLQFKQDFVYTDQVTVRNLNPLPGEQREYHPVFEEQTGQLLEEYALITVGPNTAGRSGQALVMVLAGLHSEGTAAAAEFVTSKRYLAEFNQQLGQAGTGGKPPRHYQALLKVSVDNGIPTTTSLISIHELR